MTDIATCGVHVGQNWFCRFIPMICIDIYGVHVRQKLII